MRPLRLGGLVCLFAIPAQAPAQTAPVERPVLRAHRITERITLDGRLDEPAWAAAEAAEKFTQFDPSEGQPGTERTLVRVLVDEQTLYIGAQLFERNPANVRARLSRRDEPVDGDIFAVSIDSRHDHLSAYYFRVTAGGALRDAVVQAGGGAGLDLSWDAVWDAKVQVDSSGWSTEIAIPLSQLPHAASDDAVFGIQFERFRWNQQEQTYFSFTPKREEQGIRNFGHLVGLGRLPPPKRLELLPYVTSRAELHPEAAVTALQSEHEVFGSAGLDFKLKPAPGYVVTGTVNPDFGQVEVDPAVVNLSQFETFFPERRPFFVEGQEMFEFGRIRALSQYGHPSLFFSRRIGRTPTLSPNPIDYPAARAPARTTILGAAKLTGKSHGWSTAVLDAVTAEERARFVGPTGIGRIAVEPLTNYFVGRVRRELRAGDTQIGGFFASTERSLGDPALAAVLHSGTVVGGVDLNHAWSGRRWALDASFAVSEVFGSPAAITETQISSRRYYDRPDAHAFHLDPTRSSLGGFAAQVAVTKLSGLHWLASAAYQGVSHGFEANDLGFQIDADRHALAGSIGYQENRPGRLLRNYSLFLANSDVLNSDGNLVFHQYALALFGRLLNFSGLNAQLSWFPPALDDRVTRGGPLAHRPANGSLTVDYFSDSRKRYILNLNLNYTASTVGGNRTGFGAELTVQPTSTFSFTLGPSWERTHSVAQYLARVPDPLATTTFGNRYVFSTIDQRQIALTGRLAWTFTPRLSLQLYVQPLIASAAFTEIKQFRQPRQFAFDVFGRDLGTITRQDGSITVDPDANPATANQFVLPDPDFNLRSLRGNAVLRWEYRRGATLFLVWQQLRAGADPIGDFRLGRDASALFRTPAENVFAVKATYWLTR